MNKLILLLTVLVALPGAQMLAQSRGQAPAAEQPGSSKQQTAPRRSGVGTDPVRPATAQRGPAERPDPQIVPPQGAETGINPSQKPDHAAPTAPKEAAPASAADRELRQDIQNAIAHEPTLGNARVQVGVAAGTITLDGTVRTGKDRQAATRIAKSFAGDREVVDHITILGQAPPAQ